MSVAASSAAAELAATAERAKRSHLVTTSVSPSQHAAIVCSNPGVIPAGSHTGALNIRRGGIETSRLVAVLAVAAVWTAY